MNKHILIIEDEPQVAALLEGVLERDGFSVSVADSVAQARTRLTERTPILSLVDLGLPDGRGLSLICETLVHQNCGIIVVTGSQDETDMVLGLELGADDFVTKPFRPRALLARVHAVLRRTGRATDPVAPPAEPNALTFGTFKMDLDTGQVLDRTDTEVALTTAEADLLRVFLNHRGETVDRERLMSELYGGARYGTPRAVDGLVSRLRRKFIEHGDGSMMIRTMHRRGYRFIG